MTTATRPLPPHGTTARAKGRPAGGVPGCHCNPCMVAARRYDGWRRLRNLSPDTTLSVPAAPVADHLRLLLAAGAGWLQLQHAAGCSSSTISAILNGRVDWVRRDTARRITALQPGDAVPGRRLIDATGARRLHALMAIGHTITAISKRARVDDELLQQLVAGRAEVTRGVADRIARAYRAMAAIPGSNQRAINRARREGWHSPAAWGAAAIDDPAAVPEVDDTPPTTHRLLLAEQRREDIRHLAEGGVSEAEIARRVGMAPNYVHDLIHGLRRAR